MRTPLTPAISLLSCCSLALSAACAISFGAQQDTPADVSGTWHLTLAMPDGGNFEGTLRLKEADGRISGTWQRENEDNDLDVNGEVEGNRVSFHWIMDLHTGGGNVRAVARADFVGEVAGDTMRGTARFSRSGDDLPWTAERID
jgi:hypothetical protein